MLVYTSFRFSGDLEHFEGRDQIKACSADSLPKSACSYEGSALTNHIRWQIPLNKNKKRKFFESALSQLPWSFHSIPTFHISIFTFFRSSFYISLSHSSDSSYTSFFMHTLSLYFTHFCPLSFSTIISLFFLPFQSLPLSPLTLLSLLSSCWTSIWSVNVWQRKKTAPCCRGVESFSCSKHLNLTWTARPCWSPTTHCRLPMTLRAPTALLNTCIPIPTPQYRWRSTFPQHPNMTHRQVKVV